MKFEDFSAVLKNEILETDTEIDLATNLNEIEEWDSLAFVSFIAFVKELGVKNIDNTILSKAETVEELYTLVKAL